MLESDIVFDEALLEDMLLPDRIALASLQPWMNGTTVTLNKRQLVEAFWCGGFTSHDVQHYKTVNMYSLSRTSWQLVRERLDQHIETNKVDGYYETVFAEMVAEGCLSFTPVFFDPNRWYEIDTINDLHAAEQIFPSTLQTAIAHRRGWSSHHVSRFTPALEMPPEMKPH